MLPAFVEFLATEEATHGIERLSIVNYRIIVTTPFVSNHSVDLGPPRPSAGEGLGVRWHAHSWSFSPLF
jgi:hypothetical protein